MVTREKWPEVCVTISGAQEPLLMSTVMQRADSSVDWAVSPEDVNLHGVKDEG